MTSQLSNIGLNNLELQQYTKLLNVNNVFHGVYMKDQLHNIFIKNGAYIFNLESSYMPTNGSHWTAAVVFNGISCYFDSFGATAPLEIIYFLKKDGRKICYNRYICQNLQSSLCGFYCLAFIKFMLTFSTTNRIELFNKFVNLFGEDTKRNSVILKQFLYKYIKQSKNKQLYNRLKYLV